MREPGAARRELEGRRFSFLAAAHFLYLVLTRNGRVSSGGPRPESQGRRVGERRSGPSFFGEATLERARIEAQAVGEAHETGILEPRSGRSGQNIAAVEVLDDDLASRGRGALALEGGAHRGDQGGDGRLQQFFVA